MSKAKTSRPLGRTLKTFVMLLLAGILLAPVAVYVFGVNLIAPYEGDGGALGFLGSIYGEALNGEAAAWALILSPTLFVLTWWVALRLVRACKQPPRPDA